MIPAPLAIIIEIFLCTLAAKRCLRKSHSIIMDAIRGTVRDLLAGRTSRLAASAVAGICNTRYMAHPGWYFTTSFMWQGQMMRCQLSHRVARMN